MPQPIDGVSLVPVLKDPTSRVRDHAYHAYPRRKLGRAIRTDRYRLVEWRSIGASYDTAEYELYDYTSDPLETRNLAATQPKVVAQLQRILATYPEPVSRRRNGSASQSPKIAKQCVTISGHVASADATGVVVAQGGQQYGYALHLVNRQLAFDVRLAGKVQRVLSVAAPQEFDFELDFTATKVTLRVNQKEFQGKSPGLIQVQPQDGMQIGRDEQSAAGDYTAPNPLKGKVSGVKVRTRPSP